jgi:hypothetical protein
MVPIFLLPNVATQKNGNDNKIATTALSVIRDNVNTAQGGKLNIWKSHNNKFKLTAGSSVL